MTCWNRSLIDALLPGNEVGLPILSQKGFETPNLRFIYLRMSFPSFIYHECWREKRLCSTSLYIYGLRSGGEENLPGLEKVVLIMHVMLTFSKMEPRDNVDMTWLYSYQHRCACYQGACSFFLLRDLSRPSLHHGTRS
jgi:hypothetical protein